MGRSGESGTQVAPSFFITEGVVGPIPVKRNVRKITGLTGAWCTEISFRHVWLEVLLGEMSNMHIQARGSKCGIET